MEHHHRRRDIGVQVRAARRSTSGTSACTRQQAHGCEDADDAGDAGATRATTSGTGWDGCSPTKLVVSGADEAIVGNAILIANHQTFADWWYMWCWAYTKNQHDSFKIILKHSLKNIPVWGWVRGARGPGSSVDTVCG